jgi:hypothetical protein
MGGVLSAKLRPPIRRSDDAKVRGVSDGACVQVLNHLGNVHLRLSVTDAIARGVFCTDKRAWLRTSDNGQTISLSVRRIRPTSPRARASTTRGSRRKGFRRRRDRAGLARPPGHARDRHPRVHRARAAAAGPPLETVRRRSDLRAVVHRVPARRPDRAGRSCETTGCRARSDGLERARDSNALRSRVPRPRPSRPRARGAARPDAAGHRVADDGRARARGVEGARRRACPRHAACEFGGCDRHGPLFAVVFIGRR